MARCCELAGVVFIGLSHNLLYFHRKEGAQNVLRIPMREVTPLRILLELCADHSRATTNCLAATPSTTAARGLIAVQGE
jgi:hypothetical protein